MMKVTVLYGQPVDPAAFDAHYFGTHRELVDKIPGLLKFEVARAVATPDGSPLPYYVIASLYFDSLEALQAGMGGAEGQAVRADLANFASGGVTPMICAVTT